MSHDQSEYLACQHVPSAGPFAAYLLMESKGTAPDTLPGIVGVKLCYPCACTFHALARALVKPVQHEIEDRSVECPRCGAGSTGIVLKPDGKVYCECGLLLHDAGAGA